MTQQAAQQAQAALLSKAGRKRVTTGPAVVPKLHVGTWGQQKTRKSSLIVRARTSEVRLPPTVAADFSTTPGEVVMPSRPLRIAYANFDRNADTLWADLQGDEDIIEEEFYEDEEGVPLSLTGPAQIARVLNRFREFINDLERDKDRDLFGIDGGTIVWEHQRGVHLDPLPPAGKTPEGDPRHLPRQYGPANNAMRQDVMQRVYNMPIHTVITREAGERWAGQNAPMEDPREPGGVALRQDGWNKTGYYVDLDVQMRVVKNDGQPPRHTAIFHTSIRAELIGTEMLNPTFGKLYSAVYHKPLLLPEQVEEFNRLMGEHDGKLVWD